MKSSKNYENASSSYRNNRAFYENEILPDYQERAESMLVKLRTVPDITLNHIGMEEIDGTTAWKKYFIEFASKSSLHGFNHIVARRRHPVERYEADDTSETRSFFQFLSNVTYENMHRTPNYDAVPSEKWLRILHDLRHEFHSTFGDMEDATMRWVITEKGICLSVRNYVNIYATLEYWLQDNWTVIPPPEVIPFYDFENNGDIESVTTLTAMKIIVHDSSEIVEYQQKQFDIGSLVLGRYIVSISQRISSLKVMELTVKQRKCKFQSDARLKMWPIYTFNMCVIECRYRTIRQYCNCFPHFARPIAGVPVCNAAQLRCIASIKDQLFLHEQVPAGCNCLPNCNDVDYAVEKSSTSIIIGEYTHNMSVFNMIVNFPRIIFRREKVFGFNDFLTAIGSTAGLFLGASVLSFIEILYYVTLRLWVYCAKRNKRRRNIVTKKFVRN